MNIYDIAAEAGVSISTVSRVMNHKGNVNPEMKKRIEEVLKKYDYKPSAIARGLVSKTMKTIAILTADMRVSLFARTIYMIEQEFYQKGYNVIVCNTGERTEHCGEYLNILSEKQVDGIVLTGSVFNCLKEQPELTNMVRQIPVVMAGGWVDLPNFYSVLVDDKKGISAAVDLLAGRGRREILFFGGQETETRRQKRAGFLEAMKARGLSGGERRTVLCGGEMTDGAQAIRTVLEAGISFDGLIFSEDLAAVGAMKELRRQGFQVPEDAAVIGYGNSPDSVVCEPELTTVDNKPEEVGVLCAKVLRDLLERKEAERRIVVEPELIARESAGK